MNYYQPREIAGPDGKGTGRWHYSVRNDDWIRPVGYCADGCRGHETREGAYEHQTAYMLDHELRLDGNYDGVQCPCEAVIESGARVGQKCEAWTSSFAEVGRPGRRFSLCDLHRNRDVVAKLYGSVGDSISSW